MGEKRFGRDVFIALAAVGWADGDLDQEEADAIVRTALEEGLELEDVEAIREATKTRVEMGAIDISGMSKADRLFVYAVASWMTRLDNVVTVAEQVALDQLGQALKIPEAPRAHADEIAKEIAELPEGDRVDRYDLPKLRRTIQERLDAAHRARLAMKEAAEAPAAEGDAKPEEPAKDAAKPAEA